MSEPPKAARALARFFRALFYLGLVGWFVLHSEGVHELGPVSTTVLWTVPLNLQLYALAGQSRSRRRLAFAVIASVGLLVFYVFGNHLLG